MIKIQKYNTKRLKAFSLTEVLITMFVIMIIIIASAPVITKKQVKNKRPHGVWECKLDINGKHYSTTTIENQAPSTSAKGDFCTFNPQINAENYSVTVIGGGGGGASGSSYAVDAVSYGSSTGYLVPAPGEYDVLVVGGGGGGSARLGYRGNLGGAAGGVVVRKNLSLSKGDYCVLEAGMGGEAGGAVSTETGDGEDTACTSATTNPAWKDACNGQDGSSSKFYVFAKSTTIEATGGKGAKSTGTASYGTPYACSTQRPSGSTGGRIFSGGNCTEAKNFLQSSNIDSAIFGQGGNGSTTSVARPGVNGVVMLISSSFHSGGGGKRGSTAYMTIEKIKDPVKVFVGTGGAGAITEDTNGEQGQNSAFGYYITAKGGAGGEARAKSSTLKSSGLSGEAGSISPYGGSLAGGSASCSATALNGQNNMDVTNGVKVATETTYGSGGGGGGAHSKRSTNCNIANKWGKGGRGMPGYVRVEWN